MIKIGITQIKNSTEIEDNFSSIMKSLEAFQSTDTDLVMFPECSLSGFSAKIKECTPELVSKYISTIEKWSLKFNKYVVLPTAIVEGDVFNTGFVFGGGEIERFYKLGLTESEQKFFSKPGDVSNKIFRIKGYNLAILICFEAQMGTWDFFKNGEVDVVLWPGYWGWEKGDSWQEFRLNGEQNLIFKNMEKWKLPLLQSNFSFNELEEHRDSGPHGLSMFVDSNNKLFAQGEYDKEACYQITINKNEIINYEKISDL